MKTATIPSLRVDAALREAAESVLESGESLSSFVEQSIREQIARRQAQKEFIARGLASRELAKRTGVYFSTDEVLQGLDRKIAESKQKYKKSK